jgi:nucleotide-binding universal stress UspA family protein
MAGRIVVGVDNSPAAVEALRFAADEARLRNARIVAVHAWTYMPAAGVGDPGLMALPDTDVPGLLEAEREAAETSLRKAIEGAFPEGPPDELEARLVDTDPEQALLAAAKDAELVVVGSRGHGDLSSALLGSVSSHVVHHAACPVVVVKAPS